MAEVLKMAMDALWSDGPRGRSDSTSSTASQGSKAKLRQRLAQLLTRVEDLSSNDEASEDVSRTLDHALQLCGRFRDTFRLHMVTWNVATADPPRDVTSLLQLDVQPPTDLYVIGLQEVNSSPLRMISDLIVDDSWSHLLMETLAPRGYIKVVSVRMQGLLLLLFSRQKHLPFIRDLQTCYTRTGIFGYWGNKGGVSVRFAFYGHMVCFLNVHLAAHMNAALQRLDEFEYILDTQDFDLYNTPRILDHTVVFWFGDLNFRIADHGMHFLRSSINSQRFSLLWERDQLLMMRKKEAFLQEFEEGPLNFKPTYKFDRNSESYDTSGKKRKPAWTDRILWRIKPKAPPPEPKAPPPEEDDREDERPIRVLQDTYTCDLSYGVSDHKPVLGTFSLELGQRCVGSLVRLGPEGCWSADQDNVLSYAILDHFRSSTWDWVGLYKVGFKTPSDYTTFVWVKDDELVENQQNQQEVQVFVSKDEVPVLGGEYVLGYYSANMQSIVGLSSNFQILSKRAVMEGVPENINGLDK